MKIPPFKLERYFAEFEFSSPFLLSCSDCEPLKQSDLLAMADDEILGLWKELRLAYTESQGHPLLRREIASLYSAVKSGGVMVAVPEEAIFIAMNILLKPGDHVITTFPGYQSLYQVAESLGCSMSRWLPDDSGEFDPDDLFKQVSAQTRLMVINFPHNPTGNTVSEGDLQKIITFARERNIFIFSDEMYRLLEYEPARRLSPVADLYEQSVSLFGMSKSFALPGLRIGWLATQNIPFIEECLAFKDYTTICSSAPSEILAIMGLRNRERIVKRNLDIIGRNLELISRFAASCPDQFIWKVPKGGTIAFPELKINRPTADFCLDLNRQYGVMLLPAEVYDYPKPCVRLGFGRESFPKAFEQFTRFFKKYIQLN